MLFILILCVCAYIKGDYVVLPDNLPINKNTVTVSGVSSGGAMAIQTHMAHSSIINGAAIYAAPPYYCAMGNLEVAMESCMKCESDPGSINVLELYLITLNTASLGFIDGVNHLMKDRVWLFTALNDSVVNSEAVHKTRDFYLKFLFHSSQLATVFNIEGEHAWATNKNSLKDCNFLGKPYINNCKHDFVGDFLNHILMSPHNMSLIAPTPQQAKNLFKFKQSLYTPISPSEEYGMHEDAYIYIPEQCQKVQSEKHCHLHVSFHGCLQNDEVVGEQFFRDTGLNEYAESNDLVILYPQAHSSKLNPNGCWDWWGYSGPQYASNVGLQIRTIKNLLDRLLINVN
ncbi:feruloyl esterase B [Acrasis kona]|uniref:Feruloyl esterase B n=1 Tax=Acrasis kona TaxID=1008807 RepID=A0AAW2ZET1_9EUKA